MNVSLLYWYHNAASEISLSLSKHYATWDQPEHEAILVGATGNKPEGKEVNVSLIYGDYFYVEALAKMMGWKNRAF